MVVEAQEAKKLSITARRRPRGAVRPYRDPGCRGFLAACFNSAGGIDRADPIKHGVFRGFQFRRPIEKSETAELSRLFAFLFSPAGSAEYGGIAAEWRN
jgi:hypothetical protein